MCDFIYRFYRLKKNAKSIITTDRYIVTQMKSTAAGRRIRTADDERERTERTGATAKAKYLVRTITVEPVLGLYMVATVLSSFATQNLNLDKACRVNLALNDSACGSRGERGATSAAETLAQQLVADVVVWKTIVQCAITGVLVVFAGSWSDRNRKRKPCMLVPVLGEFLATAARLLCYYYYYQLPMEVTAVAETVPAVLTGGAFTLVLSVFSYIGDVTTVSVYPPRRTRRVVCIYIYMARVITI